MAKKMRLEFTGFEEYAERLDKLGGDLKKTTEKALNETHKLLTPKVEEAFRKHDVKYSHDTMKSLKKDARVEWDGSVAAIGVGFKISEGGFTSIFIMYGTPRMQPDKKVYNSIYGNKKKVRELQEKIFAEEIAKL
jgi:hypothetical protein